MISQDLARESMLRLRTVIALLGLSPMAETGIVKTVISQCVGTVEKLAKAIESWHGPSQAYLGSLCESLETAVEQAFTNAQLCAAIPAFPSPKAESVAAPSGLPESPDERRGNGSPLRLVSCGHGVQGDPATGETLRQHETPTGKRARILPWVSDEHLEAAEADQTAERIWD